MVAPLDEVEGHGHPQCSPARLARVRAHPIEFGTVHHSAFPFMLISAVEQEAPYLERVRRAGREVEQEMTLKGGK